jgi:tRNA nucleotidyltransferase (CCA-adding enzyme)
VGHTEAVTTTPTDLRARIEALPGMDRLLPALDGLPPVFLVGGAVRDLLLGSRSVDLDLALEGDAEAAAHEVAARLGGAAKVHERFGTATVRAGGLSLDLATTRRERYLDPGALPEVEPASLEQDLGRRDFTINAMAASLAAGERGRLHDPYGGSADLEAGVVRVLHRHSFIDDPTRLLRAVRYEARLGFAMDPDTDALARAAVAAGATATVSGQRLGGELLLVLAEERLEPALARLADLGLDRALHPSLVVHPPVAADAARAAARTGADSALAALAALVEADADALGEWLEGLGLEAPARDRVLRAARTAQGLARALAEDACPRPSDLRRLLDAEPAEALALALALGAAAEPISHYLDSLRDVRLDINGDDLVAAGIPPSPALGRALDETLARKLDGEVSGRDEELRLALSLARGREAR